MALGNYFRKVTIYNTLFVEHVATYVSVSMAGCHGYGIFKLATPGLAWKCFETVLKKLMELI